MSSNIHTTLGLRRPTRYALIAVMTVFLVIILLRLYWIIVSATKNQAELYGSFGFWFHGPFSLWQNIHDLFTYRSDIFGRWLLNTAIYSLDGGGGATILACLGGYAFSGSNSGARVRCSPPSLPRCWFRRPRSPFRRTFCTARSAW